MSFSNAKTNSINPNSFAGIMRSLRDSNQIDLDEEEAFEWIWIANIEQFGVEVYASVTIDKEVFTWKELAPVDKIAAINKLRNISNLTIADAKIVVEEFLAQ